MSKKFFHLTIESKTAHPSVNQITIQGQATLSGETATAPIEALLMRPTEDQLVTWDFIHPGSTIFASGTSVDIAGNDLLIIDQFFLDIESFQVCFDEHQKVLDAQKVNDIENTLELLAWIDRCKFPGDFESDLIGMGVEPIVASGLRMGLVERGRVKTLTEMFQDNINGGEYRDAIIRYAVVMAADYAKIQARVCAPKSPQYDNQGPGL